MFDMVILSQEHVRTGQLRGLAVTAQATGAVSEPAADCGFCARLRSFAWQGLMAPKGTPPQIINHLNTELNAALADPKLQKRLTDLGSMPMPMTPDEFGKLIVKEMAKWEKVIKFANIKAK